MGTAENGLSQYRGTHGRLRLLKIVAVLLVIVCAETYVYGHFGVPVGKSAAHSAALSPEEARRYMRTTPGLLVIDVRSQKEFADGHVPNAINMPLYAFNDMVKSIPQDAAVLLHCQYGYRALQAYKLFRRLRPDIVNIRYAAGQLHLTPLPQESLPKQ